MRFISLLAVGIFASVNLFQVHIASSKQFTDTSQLQTSNRLSHQQTLEAIEYVSDLGIMTGNPDGSFFPFHLLNRAEFATLAMRLVDVEDMAFALNCFPDVPVTAWYAVSVCKARAYGLLRGNVEPGVPASGWKFVPERSVNLAEVLKIMVEVFDVPVDEQKTNPWYMRYFEAAENIMQHDAALSYDLTTISTGFAGRNVTRGEVARILMAFHRYVHPEVLEKEESVSSSSVAAPISSSSSSISSSSSSSVQSVVYDTHSGTDDSSTFLLLSDVSAPLGAFDIFAEHEPLDVDEIRITLTSVVSSIDSLFIYDERDGRLLGSATRDSALPASQYSMKLPAGSLVIPRGEEYQLYVRAQMKPFEVGGTSGEDIQISRAQVLGYGVWSSQLYSELSQGTFNPFTTSRGIITSITNPTVAEAPLIEGQDRQIGSFAFVGHATDGRSQLAVTALTFDVSNAGGISLSNVMLTVPNSSTEHPCSVSGNQILCTSIPTDIGEFDDDNNQIRVYADIDVPDSLSEARLQLVLSQPGSPFVAGSVSWTDGSSTFSWIQFDPLIAVGTNYRQ